MNTPLPDDLARAINALPPAATAFVTGFHHYASIGSTNDEAARLARLGAPEGTCVVADMQTAGRGRLGRAWQSRAGDGLYLSIVFRPAVRALPAPETSLLTLMAGVAGARAVRACGATRAEIKWPNDLVVRHPSPRGFRKLAGILAEASIVGAGIDYVVLGIGVNLRTPEVPDARNISTSVEEETGQAGDRGALCRVLLDELALGRDALRAGDASRILGAWLALSPSARGQRIAWREGDRTFEGTTAGIDAEGHLFVQVDGDLRPLTAGEIQWA